LFVDLSQEIKVNKTTFKTVDRPGAEQARGAAARSNAFSLLTLSQRIALPLLPLGFKSLRMLRLLETLAGATRREPPDRKRSRK